MTTTNPVDAYIDAAPSHAQEKLKELRAILQEVAPEATEAVKWRSPVMEQGRILFAYAGYKDHMNFMPTPSAMRAFEKELEPFKTGKGTIHFSYDEPLPKALIKKIAAHRLKDVLENDARWM